VSFPLLKCFRTHYGRHCQPFSSQKCTLSHDCAYPISKFFGGHTPGPPQQRPWCLDPDTNFRSARQRYHYSCFTKRPLIERSPDQFSSTIPPSPALCKTITYFNSVLVSWRLCSSVGKVTIGLVLNWSCVTCVQSVLGCVTLYLWQVYHPGI